MGIIVLERSLEPPMNLDDVRAMGEQAAWCMEQYRVQHATSLLSLDGRRLTCAFVAPDAEAMRSVVRQIGVTYERLWPATIHPAADLPPSAGLATPDAALVVVERRFAAPVERAVLHQIEDRGASCLAAHRVRFLRTYLSLDGRDMICAYAAPDAESVRIAQREAGMSFDHAWSALVHDTH
jgi:hypothetical protein